MLLSLRHTTRYHFSHPVFSVVQYLRLSPRSDPSQSIRRWTVDAPGTLAPQTDAWGNLMHVQSLAGPVDTMTITVTGEVDTRDTLGVLPHDERVPLAIYRRQTPLTEPSGAIRDFACPLAAAIGADRLDGLHRLAEAVGQAVRYQGEATDVTTTAAEALDRGAGVCQDQAHVFVSTARVLGVPTRYVSGYVHVAGETGDQTASHAWAESWVDDLGWVAFDVTNTVCANDAHLRLAVGPDYLACAPVRGIRRGGGEERMDVAVKVALAEGSQ